MKTRAFVAFFFCAIFGIVNAQTKDGVVFKEIKGATGRVWVYLPEKAGAGKLPCVIVPPAGTRLFHGTELGEDVQPEHIPYAKAGFAVVSFDLSGPWPQAAPVEAQKKAIREFIKADYGIRDATNALLAAAQNFPNAIDTNRVYVAGHSSAGTLALQVAASCPWIKGCVAYAPIPDLEAHLGPAVLGGVEKLVPGATAGLLEKSPIKLTGNFKCPVFLFGARDDTLAPLSRLKVFERTLKITGVKTKLVEVEKGGHYDSMLNEGIPAAIQWLKTL
jgi:dipeptidyl aminopeptidase/acylaminoacyl peptidase